MTPLIKVVDLDEWVILEKNALEKACILTRYAHFAFFTIFLGGQLAEAISRQESRIF